MVPGIAFLACPALAVPSGVMHHVVHVESSFNPYAIGVVGGRLVRQPRTLPEAVATARMLESRGYNFSLGLAQVNRYNLSRYGLDSYEKAFESCPNLQAGSRILAECHSRSGGDWGKAFSCYYSGNFVTGYRAGYVQKVFASMQASAPVASAYPGAIPLAVAPARRTTASPRAPSSRTAAWQRRVDVSAPAMRATPILAPAPSSVAAVTAGPASPAPPLPAAATPDRPDAVAVLNPAGAPVVVPRAGAATAAPSTPSPAAAPPAAPADTAFVF